MNKRLQTRLTLLATFVMLAATALLMARNEELIFQNKGEVTVKRDPDNADTLVFIWRSKVEAPMARRFDEAYSEWRGEGKRIIIDLNSPGGVIAEGEAVIRVIERMKRTHIVDTRVRNRRACYSMCVPIFLHGETRYAAANARFMFHEPTAYDFYTGEEADLPQFEKDLTTQRYFNRYFVNSPIDPAWRDALAVEWKGKDLFYSAQQLVDQQSNIVTILE